VTEIRWQVPARHGFAAEALARGLEGPRRARIAVQVDPLPASLLRVKRPPVRPASRELSAVLAALFDEAAVRAVANQGLDRALARLWNVDANPRPPIAPERAASFLILAPAPAADLRDELRSVWIDGLEVETAQ
jgi:hypothetical protein